MTLTPRGILGGGTSEDGPGVKLTDGQEKLLELVHFPRNWPLARLTTPREGLASKLIGSLKDTAFRSWLATVTRMHNGKVILKAIALDMDLS